jgi:hypothetical protein
MSLTMSLLRHQLFVATSWWLFVLTANKTGSHTCDSLAHTWATLRKCTSIQCSMCVCVVRRHHTPPLLLGGMGSAAM